MQSSSSAYPPCVLDSRSIGVWAVRLSAFDAVVERCREILSPGERVRGNRYRFEDHRRSYILSRDVLRTLLGCYLSILPADIQFSYGTRGKPGLSGVKTDIRFNSSHSTGVALYALTRQCELGVVREKSIAAGYPANRGPVFLSRTGARAVRSSCHATRISFL